MAPSFIQNALGVGTIGDEPESVTEQVVEQHASAGHSFDHRLEQHATDHALPIRVRTDEAFPVKWLGLILHLREVGL
ncbi:hypothetical protein D3C72_1430560 [compost metagenome]